MLVFFSVSILVLTFLALPFSLTVNAGVDAGGKRGYIKRCLFFIPVYRAVLRPDGEAFHKNLMIERRKKTDEIHLNADKNDEKSIMQFFRKTPLLSAVRVRNLTLDVRLGIKDNAAATTFALAGIRAAFGAAAGFFRSREDISVYGRFIPEYNADVLQADAFGIISISIANIIYGFVTSLLYRR